MGKIAVLAYIAFSAVLVYWVLDQQLLYGSEIADWIGARRLHDRRRSP